MAYPITSVDRDRWILDRRGQKNPIDVSRPYAFLWEEEFGSVRNLVPTATIFLSNRECPFRCVMCDLWQNTVDHTVAPGIISGQIRFALGQLPPASQIKLYNAGSYFDPRAIPPDEDPEIARVTAPFDRVIVESHPAFLRGNNSDRVLRFRDRIAGRLEVAVGLETVHKPTLERLNKRMTVDDFEQAARFLKSNQVDLRVFILLSPPFQDDADGVEWACRSLDFAGECGADVCTVIPTRAGNGAIEALADMYSRPALTSLEKVIEHGLNHGDYRVFADLWDIEKFYSCECSPKRAKRLTDMNRTQRVPAPVSCEACWHSGERGVNEA